MTNWTDGLSMEGKVRSVKNSALIHINISQRVTIPQE